MSNDHSMIQQDSPLCCIFCHFGPHFKGRQVASSSTKRTRSDGAGTGGSGGSGDAAKTGLSSSSSSRAPMTMDGMSWTANDVCLASPPRGELWCSGQKTMKDLKVYQNHPIPVKMNQHGKFDLLMSSDV